jgi:rSAM/selenodomain-associated transferase 1
MPHLVIFARVPRIGTGKTRLARDIGPVGAWIFARVTLAALMRRLVSPCWQAWLARTPDRPAGRYRVPHGWHSVAQGQGDLGQRLSRIIRTLPPGPAVIIGSDAPDVTRRDIAAAFAALRAADYVIGPASDGGFWLIGAARRGRAGMALRNVRWSTSSALGDTLAALEGFRVSLLQTRDDVDDGAGFAAWRRRTRRVAADRRQAGAPPAEH